MAITSQNWSQVGVDSIIAQTSAALDNFRNSALEQDGGLSLLSRQIIELDKQEQQVLSHFGGSLDSLKQRIEDFKADAQNFTGVDLGMNFTWAYKDAYDKKMLQIQEDFKNYIIGYVAEYVGKQDVNLLTEKDIADFLNLTEESWEVLVTTGGSTVKRKGGQVGFKNIENQNKKISELIATRITPGITQRIQDFMKRYKNLPKNIIQPPKVNGDTLNIPFGAQWEQLTNGEKESWARENLDANSPEMKNIKATITKGIINTLGLSKHQAIAHMVIDHMLEINPYMFFIGGNEKQLTGLIGEIMSMILFYDLVHYYPSFGWAAQHRGLSGTQDSADIIIEDGTGVEVSTGIQVKNSIQDYALEIEGAMNNTIDFSRVGIDRLGDTLGFDSNIIENLYDTLDYNISYSWNTNHEKGEDNRYHSHTDFTGGGNSSFQKQRYQLENLQRRFENLLRLYSASLLYMADVLQTNKNFYSQNTGNILYMVNLVPFLASDMLKKIYDELVNRQKNKSVTFTSSFNSSAADGVTIIDEIEPDPHAFFSRAGTEGNYFTGRGKRYIQTAYTF